MIKKPLILLIIIICPLFAAGAQGINSGPFYQKLLMNNPALSGVEATGVLRMSYLNYFPGNSYNLNSVYLSYDSYFSELHGGTAIYISEDYLGGIVNDLRGDFRMHIFCRRERISS